MWKNLHVNVFIMGGLAAAELNLEQSSIFKKYWSVLASRLDYSALVESVVE